MFQDNIQWFSRSKLIQPKHRNTVVFLHLIIVFLIPESQCQHPLLLQIGFMNTGKTLCQNNPYVQVTGFHGSMLPAGTFSIILFCNDNGGNTSCLILLGHRRNGLISSGKTIPYPIRLTVESIDRSHQHIVGYIFQMSAEAQPRPGHGNMVGRTFPLCLDQQRHLQKIIAIPGSKRLQLLQALGVRTNADFHLSSVCRRSHITVVIHGKPVNR